MAVMVEYRKISELKLHGNNPRLIKSDKFKKLVQSIKDFPEMLEKRPLVVDEGGTILGGNQRFRACLELKLKEVPVIVAKGWTEEQKKEFVIKDNVSSGEFDFNVLANEWQMDELNDWGLNIGGFDTETFELNEKIDNEPFENEKVNDEPMHQLLSDQFIVPPFSVFDTKQGYWQARKNYWKSLGIKSEVGRDGNLLNYSETILQASNPKQKFIETIRKNSPNSASIESKIPNYYQKRQSGLTDNEIIKEFIDNSSLGGTSIFDPVLCEISYKWFCNEGGTVLDPFAGGSVRGIVASRLNRKYIGIDLREEQITANQKQVSEICKSNYPTYLVGSSENIKKMIISLEDKPQIDMIFTCPPYYDLEKYSESNEDLSAMSSEQFDKAYENIIEQSIELLSEDSFSVFVVGDVRDKKGAYLDLIGKTVEAHRKAGAVYYNSAILLESVGTAGMRAARIFNGGRKLCKVHQNVLIFYKGNIANIKSKFVEILSEIDLSNAIPTNYGDKLKLEI